MAPSPSADRPDLPPALEELRRGHEAIAQRARDVVEGLSEAQLAWRPEPGRWSIAGCLAHLSTAGEAIVPRLEKAVAQAEPDAEAAGPVRPGLLARTLIFMMEPPHRLRLKAPPLFVPAPVEDPAAELPRFLALKERLVRCIEDGAGRDLRRPKVPSPAEERMRLAVGEWLRFIAAHERRHLWQAERLRRSAAFPEGGAT